MTSLRFLLRMIPTAPLAAVLAALLGLLPGAARAEVRMAIDEMNPRGAEGDPIDSNDYGSGSGGSSGDDLEEAWSGAVSLPKLPGTLLDQWTVLLVPDGRGGLTVFSFVMPFDGDSAGEAADAR
jgi:hypothetical protein